MYNSVTIKIGSNVLTRSDSQLNIERIEHITEQVAELHKKGVKVILVSSGAVASGRSVVSLPTKIDSVSSRQVLSAVGQVKLLTTYEKLFENHGITCAQVLVTKQDFSTREHYLNMKNCFSALLDNNIIPIVNENDAVSITALMFTDNDELAGLVSSMMNTEALFILSNVNGIYDGDPKNPDSKLIREIDTINTNLEDYVTTQKSNFGRGGMLTKGRVAINTAAAGINVHIANGESKNIIADLTKNHPEVPHTFFKADEPKPAVKKWMAYSAGFAPAEVHINEGAQEALCSDKANSLLLAGVTKLPDSFQKGDLLKIIGPDKKMIGIGKAQYDRKKALEHLNSKKYRPLIHYDYLHLYP